MNFLKNIGVGLVGLVGGILAVIILTVLFGGLFLILSALGIVSYAAIKILGGIIIGAGAVIGFVYLIGYIIRRAREV